MTRARANLPRSALRISSRSAEKSSVNSSLHAGYALGKFLRGAPRQDKGGVIRAYRSPEVGKGGEEGREGGGEEKERGPPLSR